MGITLSIIFLVVSIALLYSEFKSFGYRKRIKNLSLNNIALVSAIAKSASDIESYKDAERLWEVSMMKLVGEDGVGSVSDKIRRLRFAIREAIIGLDNVGGQDDIRRIRGTLLKAIKSIPDNKPYFPVRLKK